MLGKAIEVINKQELAQLIAQLVTKVSYNSDKNEMMNLINGFTTKSDTLLKFIASGQNSIVNKLDGTGKTYLIQPYGLIEDIDGALWVMVNDVATNVTDNKSGYPTTDRIDGTSWYKLTLNKLYEKFSPWKDLPLANGWVAFDNSHNPPQYKIENNKVELRGLIKSGTTAIVCTMPANARPKNINLLSSISNSVFCRVDIIPSGNVQLQSYNNVWVSLNGLSYYLD